MQIKSLTDIKKMLPDDKDRSLFYHFLKWLLVIAIIFTTLLLVTKPLRKIWAKNYVKSGDQYLLQKKYLSAELEYEKAQSLYNLNPDAKSREALARNSAKDIREIEPFYKEKNLGLQLELVKEATTVPQTEFKAAKNAKDLIEKSEFQLAIIAATTATEMNGKYRDGWLYLAIANMKTAQLTELSKTDRTQYVSAAQSAIVNALELDPEYEPTHQYQDEISKL